jgi:threonylcarbamoyladenosine tRNA methylthiotransferase MtaB
MARSLPNDCFRQTLSVPHAQVRRGIRFNRTLEQVGGSFHIENFGCRAARADGEAVADRLKSFGHSLSQLPEADLVVVNTCSVTAEADREARAYIRRAHRLNPDARIVVTGCYAQRAPQELAGIPGVAAVIGNSHKSLAPQIAAGLLGSESPSQPNDFVPVASILPSGSIWADDRFAHSFLEEAQLTPGEQTRPNLKIQEGCSNRCTFCVIPETRGPSRSLPAEAILTQVRGFIAAGGNELVLSGINLGRWGRDLPEKPSFAGLIRTILAAAGLPRLRLSSIEPMDWDTSLIELMAEYGGTRLARHAHLPLQSGSDPVLRRMHRRYRPWHYVEKVAMLREAAGPALTLGADVMVGFPGETDAEFAETCQFIRHLPFGYLHLFPFSPRPNTPGWELHRQSPVPKPLVHERMAELSRIAAEKSRAHRAFFAGQTLQAITLNTPVALRNQGRTSALTENFLPLEISGEIPANRLVRIVVAGITAKGELWAQLPAWEQ